MTLTKVTDILDAHQSLLGNQPNADDGISASDLKIRYDRDVNRLKTFINDILTAEIDLTFATKSEIAGIILGQIIDGSLTDIKLSDTAGQIKDRLATLKSSYDAFVATKGVANGIPTLDANTLLPISQIPSYLLFGSGIDGTVTITGATTLTRDMFYENLTINSGVTLKTAGFKIYVRGTLTNNGTIDNSGMNGVDGGTSTSGTGAGVGGGAGGSGNNNSGGTGSVGGNGGLGGGYIYNSLVTSSSNPIPLGTAYSSYDDVLLALIEGCHSYTRGGGAGGNGAMSSQTAYQSGITLYGGAGGGGGGRIHIYASVLINNGTIKSNGGNGGNSAMGSTPIYYAGAGAGGGGGFALLVYRSFTGNNPVVNGGLAGTNSSGNTALNGTNGTNGYYKKLQIA